jgi:anti-sigma factor RsiW
MSLHADSERCAEVLDWLDAWIDGELDEARAAAVQAHIDQCDSCRAEWQLAETVVSELRALPEFDIPERVLRTVRKKPLPPLAERLRAFLADTVFRPLPGLAAIAAVVLLVLVLSPWRRPPEPQYTEQEVARAAAETRLALAYVGDIAQRAELRVKQRVLEQGVAVQTARGFRRSLELIGEAGSASADLPATPPPQEKGS